MPLLDDPKTLNLKPAGQTLFRNLSERRFGDPRGLGSRVEGPGFGVQGFGLRLWPLGLWGINVA